jgi:hypothetical protein
MGPEVSGRSRLLAVEAHDGVHKIGEGTHRRGAVDLETFAKRLASGELSATLRGELTLVVSRSSLLATNAADLLRGLSKGI